MLSCININQKLNGPPPLYQNPNSPHAIFFFFGGGGGSWVECKRGSEWYNPCYITYACKFSLLSTVTACDKVNLCELINTNLHTTHVSVFYACWLKERDCLLQICKLFYNAGSPVFMYIFVSTRNEWFVWRHTQEFLDWVDNKNICWPLLFVFPPSKYFPSELMQKVKKCFYHYR